MDSFEEKQAENFVSFDDVQPIAPPKKNVLPSEINPNAPHWNVFSAIGIWLTSVVAMFFLVGLAIAIYVSFKGASPDNTSELIKDPNAILVNLVAIFPAHLLTLAAAWALVTRVGKQPFFKTMGWHRARYFGFWSCLGITILLLMTGGAIVHLAGEQENDLMRILQSSRAAVYLTAIMATLTAPLVEEVVYRGILYPAFERKYGMTAAIALVTFLFAVVHVPQYLDYENLGNVSSYATIAVITILSLTLTLIRAGTSSLLPCFIIHTIFNGIQSILLIAEPYLPKTLAPDAPEVSAALRLLNFN